MAEPIQFKTQGDLVREWQGQVSRAQIERVCLTYHIEEDARVGIIRVYRPETVARIRSALARSGIVIKPLAEEVPFSGRLKQV